MTISSNGVANERVNIRQDLVVNGFPEAIIRSIINGIELILQTCPKGVKFIVLFGSCARGTYTISSDIDLLVISKSELPKNNVLDIRYELLDKEGFVSCDVLFYSYDLFKKSNKLIVSQIKNEGVILWKEEETPTMV